MDDQIQISVPVYVKVRPEFGTRKELQPATLIEGRAKTAKLRLNDGSIIVREWPDIVDRVSGAALYMRESAKLVDWQNDPITYGVAVGLWYAAQLVDGKPSPIPFVRPPRWAEKRSIKQRIVEFFK